MAVQQIIEFAKMVPGFMNLLQDDQIMLLKGGMFTISLNFSPIIFVFNKHFFHMQENKNIMFKI